MKFFFNLIAKISNSLYTLLMITLKPLFGFLAYNRIPLKELAQKSGVCYQTILLMRRNNTFNAKNLDKICTCLNIGIKDVMRYES